MPFDTTGRTRFKCPHCGRDVTAALTAGDDLCPHCGEVYLNWLFLKMYLPKRQSAEAFQADVPGRIACWHCGYDISNTLHDGLSKCPECGEEASALGPPVPVREELPPLMLSRAQWWWVGVCWCAPAIGWLVGLPLVIGPWTGQASIIITAIGWIVLGLTLFAPIRVCMWLEHQRSGRPRLIRASSQYMAILFLNILVVAALLAIFFLVWR